ncbi:MAG: DUF4252 domain-containing protein [Tenacibaculum sp.]|nr:DUF4252 domain-containing protein [Tenacibaculum sp.]
MKKLYIILAVLGSVIFTSCKKETLQTYLVDCKEKDNFVTLDFSANTLLSISDTSSFEDKEAFKSIRKVNIAFLQKDKASEEEIKTEREKLKSILNNSEYKELMKFKHKEHTGTIYYLGESTDLINEVIIFGYSDDFGVGVVRLLGKNMDPTAIANAMKNVKPNKDELKKLKGIF